MAQFNFSLETSFRLLARAKEAGLTEEELINQLLDSTTPQSATEIPYATALQEALYRARAKKQGEEFRVEQLFTPAEWQRVEAKKHVGRFFRTHAENELVAHIGKTETNHAIYRRL